MYKIMTEKGIDGYLRERKNFRVHVNEKDYEAFLKAINSRNYTYGFPNMNFMKNNTDIVICYDGRRVPVGGFGWHAFVPKHICSDSITEMFDGVFEFQVSEDYFDVGI